MCPIGIVLTDSPYVPATDTLTENRCKSTKKGKNVVPLERKKNPQPNPVPELRNNTNHQKPSLS